MAKRTNLTAIMRNECWINQFGENFSGKCAVGCGNSIKITDYECGHIVSVADGGLNEISNLRPICGKCNKSMGAENMILYINRHGYRPSWIADRCKIKTGAIVANHLYLDGEPILRYKNGELLGSFYYCVIPPGLEKYINIKYDTPQESPRMVTEKMIIGALFIENKGAALAKKLIMLASMADSVESAKYFRLKSEMVDYEYRYIPGQMPPDEYPWNTMNYLNDIK